MKKTSLILIPLLMLGACSPLQSATPPAAIYSLHARPMVAEIAPAKTAGGSILTLARPALPAGFDTDKIALYFDQGRRLEYYADAKWAARLDNMLHDVALEKARQNYPAEIIETSDIPVPIHYRLHVKIIDFQPTYSNSPDTPPRLDVALAVTMVAYPDEKIVKHFTVRQEGMAQNNNLTAITAGLETLYSSVLDTAFKLCAPVLTTPPKDLTEEGGRRGIGRRLRAE